MKKLTIKGSENYQCQVIKLPAKIQIPKLDNLVEVNHQGNSCLVGKDSDENELHLFFPCECAINSEFLSKNNLFRHSELNSDKDKTGFFDDNRRVKVLKFKGIVSTGFIIPLTSLLPFCDISSFKVGDEFNQINEHILCEKYIKPNQKTPGMSNPKGTKILDEILDSKFAPEHMDTSHLLKNVHKLDLKDYIAVTYKLHGTSFRIFRTLVNKKLTKVQRVLNWFGVDLVKKDYDYVAASRRSIKSVGFETLPNKNHFFTEGDIWSEVAKEFFQDKLHKGESVYGEIIGSTYNGSPIQGGYTYGFLDPKVYIYRISMINSDGIEIDLPYHQMKTRAEQLGIEPCPDFYYGTLETFLLHGGLVGTTEEKLERIFYNQLLEKPSILDNTVVEEGFCIRVDKYPKPEIFKIKSKKFLLHEGHQLDVEVENIEDAN